MKKLNIVISTIGTVGDVLPYLSIAKSLQECGHNTVVATCEIHRELCDKNKIRFKPLSPNLDIGKDALIKRMMNSRHGEGIIFKEVILANIENSYNELFEITDDCDILINHCYCYAGPIVAEKKNLLWISGHLSPVNFWSAFDPSIISISEYLIHLPKMGLVVNRYFIQKAKKQLLDWCSPIESLRKKLGLPYFEHPVFEGMFSKHLSLALFSSEFAKPQKDWPKSCIQTGFVRQHNSEWKNLALEKFIFENDRPLIIVAFGSSVVNNCENIYSIIENISAGSKCKFLFIGGNKGFNSDKLFYLDSVPYRSVFKYGKLIIHHGGIGTTSDAMLAGVPMIILPQFADQPDNAYRVRKLGLGNFIQKSKLCEKSLGKMIKKMLTNNDYLTKAKLVSDKLAIENANKIILTKIMDLSFKKN
jgi:rhamnosyltransferase subunit B